MEVAEGDVRTCSHRSSHTISKQAYTSGIVLIQCPECENRCVISLCARESCGRRCSMCFVTDRLDRTGGGGRDGAPFSSRSLFLSVSLPSRRLTQALRLTRHLIADHLGWFPEITQGSGEKRVLRTIEDIMQEKGETVRRGIQHGEGGNIEVF